MNRKYVHLFLILLSLHFYFLSEASGQTAAKRQSSSNRFEKALPGYLFSFPGDHGAHPSFLIEWWYFTGNLTSENGREYGYELTFFRHGIQNQWVDQNPSRWVIRDLYLAHFAITDLVNQQFHYEEKISRAGMGKAGAKEKKMSIWIDRWRATQSDGSIHLTAGKGPYKIDMTLAPLKPLVIHGKNGVSLKGEENGAASHYYSFTRLSTDGQITVAGQKMAVTGLSWMDHEFGSSLLGAEQTGWDWFSIQLDDGSEYMFYQIRQKNGGKAPVSSGTAVSPDGATRHLASEDFSLTPLRYWKSRKSGATYPVGWTISVPSDRLFLTSQPTVDNQELITSKSTQTTYWEGASRFTGEKDGSKIKGEGYIELTGYAKP